MQWIDFDKNNDLSAYSNSSVWQVRLTMVITEDTVVPLEALDIESLV